jgi:hypothetical protein
MLILNSAFLILNQLKSPVKMRGTNFCTQDSSHNFLLNGKGKSRADKSAVCQRVQSIVFLVMMFKVSVVKTAGVLHFSNFAGRSQRSVRGY